MDTKIIGREAELHILKRVYNSEEAEFVAVYGRRRIGKTYLIRHFFSKQPGLFFQVTGIHNASLNTQLKEFTKELENLYEQMGINITLKAPSTWLEALDMLTKAMLLSKKTLALFFDEFPWMATKKSKLLEAINYYWNRYWVDNKNIKLIICGSAASWIIEKVLNDKGGLHNRVTQRLPISPFTLYETKKYLRSRNISLDHQQILQLYMCIGGIPFYLKSVQKGLSATQNINDMCFSKHGALVNEFDNLFSSLFKSSDLHEAIVKHLANKRHGVTRKELSNMLSLKGGALTRTLKELEHAGFIESFLPWGKTRGQYLKLIDEYSLFYLNWMAPHTAKTSLKTIDSEFWTVLNQTPAWKAWAGYAFEAICFKHLSSIKQALHIPSGSAAMSWRYVATKNHKLPGAQIDLLFDRPDGIIQLCEIKYSNNQFNIDKEYAKKLAEKAEIYKQITKTNKQISISMITTNGLKASTYLQGLVWSNMTAKDLFVDGSCS